MKNKGLEAKDAFALLIADLFIIASMAIIIVRQAWIFLLLPGILGWVLLWYQERKISPEQRQQIRDFWKRK